MSAADELTPDVGEVVADILRAAYYYATADGHAAVGTDLVLTAAARNDDFAGSVLGTAVIDARPALQPAAGDLPAPAGPAVPVACPHAGALREARWWVLRDSKDSDRKRLGVLEPGRGGPVWSAPVCAALRRAGREAAAAGMPWIGLEHLLLGLLDEADPSVRALAERGGWDVAAVVRRLRAGGPVAAPLPDTPPLVQMLQMFGAIDQSDGWLVRWIPRWMARMSARDPQLGGPVLACLEEEALRQAVIVGHRSVQSDAVLLAVLSMDEQLEATGQRLRPPYPRHNQGGRILAEFGVDRRRAQRAAEGLTEDGGQLAAEESAQRFWGGGKPGDPPWDGHAVQLLDRAGALARAAAHPDIGTSHLLAAAVRDTGSAAVRLLTELAVDLQKIRGRVDDQLAGIDDRD